MALREFVDAGGRHWQVWSTFPSTRDQVDRIRTHLVGGWLTFMSGKERRRLVPVPDDWEDADEHRLRELLRLAQHAPQSRRLP